MISPLRFAFKYTIFTPLWVALLCLSSLVAQAQQFNTAKLDSLLTSLATNKKMMGSLALSQNGNVLYSRAFGYLQTDGAATIPATTTTRYRVGSISKVFTATMIFQLIEGKKLTLETPLATFFPQLPNASRITIDHLLSHRSGLHNFTSDPAYAGYMTQPQTQAQMLARMAELKPDFEPGSKAVYSNTNYVLLGYIVEKLTRMPYAKALHKRIVRKAGLKNTFYGGRIDPLKQEAFSYTAVATGWKPSVETDMSIPGGAGAVVSTPLDLARFLEALFGGRLVSAASLDAMKTIRDGHGRGLQKTGLKEHENYGHGGAIDDFRANIRYFPTDKLTIALTANAQSFDRTEVLRGIRNIFLGQPYSLPDLQPGTYAPVSADLDRYVGTYASTKFPLKITISRDGNTLKAQFTGKLAFPLEATRKDVFRSDKAGLLVRFDAAKPAFLMTGEGVSHEFVKEMGTN
jgi:CubicO group peptidase (beta-lactamase class C family)